ncbi:NUDIX hydrolase [Vallitalea okinawensis]|uniref:NUDIX hydrolase n=1 Tax=Vallitalea okinawensis TaxID=2078660 RepID=UPI000CFDBE80|nr:NUDIX hydrolase [Vallitalea okinawensis]
MDFKEQIKEFIPDNDQERQDKKILVQYIELFPHNVLLRDNEIAHITSSGFIMNKALDKVLMVHHNILNTWAWTGGHADGDEDFLKVAIKEAKEETGIKKVSPLFDHIASIDILPVPGHIKNGQYVSTHLHLSVAYILIASEDEKLVVKEDENSGVKWIPVERFTEDYFNSYDVYLYNKLIKKARDYIKKNLKSTLIS